jgi:hypothetical protein
MLTCEICGKFRPDSQDRCDCARVEGGSRAPVFTILSMMTTAAAAMVVIWVARTQPMKGSWAISNDMVAWAGVIPIVIVNLIVGYVAHRRREPSGGRIALAGIVLSIGILVVAELTNIFFA